MASTHSTADVPRGTLRTYFLGFILSLVFTAIPFAIVMKDWVSGDGLLFTLAAFAILQLIVQLHFFIHLGHERSPRWNLQMFLCALLVILIVAGGSLWIMKNLDYHTMSPMETNQYIEQEEGINR